MTEREFVEKTSDDIREFNEQQYYYGSNERVTIDGEWTEDELLGVVSDEAYKALNGDSKSNKKGWVEKNKNRAVFDNDLLYDNLLADKLSDEFDVIQLYNIEYDKHKDDTDGVFMIHHFTDNVQKKIIKMLNDNLVSC